MKPEAFSRREWRFRCKQLNECGRSVLGCPPRRGLVLGGATQGGQGDAKTLHVLRHQATEMAAYMGMHRYGSPHTEPLRDPML